MKDDLKKLKKEFEQALKDVADVVGLEQLEQRFFSRKSGELTQFMKGLKDLGTEMKKDMGQMANTVKSELEELLGQKREELQKKDMADVEVRESIDVTRPKLPQREAGHLHPLTHVLRDLEAVCQSMGFVIEDGPEIESDYYVYTALNFPEHHPARESMDTFYIHGHPDWTMRSHVSNMQVRLLKQYGAPLRAAYPGRSFRNEATDARHEHTFYQFEFLIVDKHITVAHMLGVIKEILKGVFKKDVAVRVRPKYYPFVEPGFNGEMTCFLCDGNGCRVCKHTGWLEIFGSGLMHPNVLRAAGLDPNEWSGLACGMGWDRIAMLKYGIEDVRHMHSGDMRFLQQF